MKVGVVGYGSIGKRHADNLTILGHEVVVYDPLTRRDVKFERKIYETCDAVVIATPSTHHTAGLRACVERKKPCLVEKPLSITEKDLRDLLDLAAVNETVVMMGNNLRFNACVMQAKQWIDAGEIGNPLWAHFTCAQATEKPLYLSDGVILNTGSHEVDMALYLLGPAKVVYADANLHDFAHAEDIADFMLLHESGCKSTFHLDFVCPSPIREAWIVGDKEKIGLDLIGRSASLGIKVERYPGNFDGDYFTEMEAFVDRIAGKDTLGASGDDGLATLQVLLDVRRKALS